MEEDEAQWSHENMQVKELFFTSFCAQNTDEKNSILKLFCSIQSSQSPLNNLVCNFVFEILMEYVFFYF